VSRPRRAPREVPTVVTVTMKPPPRGLKRPWPKYETILEGDGREIFLDGNNNQVVVEADGSFLQLAMEPPRKRAKRN
jgi:hypothetical protein